MRSVRSLVRVSILLVPPLFFFVDEIDVSFSAARCWHRSRVNFLVSRGEKTKKFRPLKIGLSSVCAVKNISVCFLRLPVAFFWSDRYHFWKRSGCSITVMYMYFDSGFSDRALSRNIFRVVKKIRQNVREFAKIQLVKEFHFEIDFRGRELKKRVFFRKCCANFTLAEIPAGISADISRNF